MREPCRFRHASAQLHFCPLALLCDRCQLCFEERQELCRAAVRAAGTTAYATATVGAAATTAVIAGLAVVMLGVGVVGVGGVLQQ